MTDCEACRDCAECGGRGTHEPDCSMPEKLAAATRLEEQQERADHQRLVEYRQYWEDMDDDRRLEELDAQSRTIKKYQAIVDSLQESFKQGVQVAWAREKEKLHDEE